LVFLGVQPDPFVDRGNITGPRHPQGDEDLGLGEDVFVEHGGPLGDQGDADPAGAAASDEVFDRAEQALPARVGALGGEGVGLVQHQVQGIAVSVIEPFGEVGHEPAPGGLGQGGQVQHGRDAFVDHEVGEESAGGLG